MPDPAAERPITAQPIGSRYYTRTRDVVPVDGRGRKLEGESITTIEGGHGCYRRVPTCKE